MKTVIAVDGDTWDSIAYKYTGDEFQCDNIRDANKMLYGDVIAFEGGENIVIPDNAVIETAIVKAPWE